MVTTLAFQKLKIGQTVRKSMRFMVRPNGSSSNENSQTSRTQKTFSKSSNIIWLLMFNIDLQLHWLLIPCWQSWTSCPSKAKRAEIGGFDDMGKVNTPWKQITCWQCLWLWIPRHSSWSGFFQHCFMLFFKNQYTWPTFPWGKSSSLDIMTIGHNQPAPRATPIANKR